MSAPVLLLRTCAADGSASQGFKWPLEVGAVVTAPDWSPVAECGRGLHGLLWGEGDGDLLSWLSDAVWMVVEADEIVGLGRKVKCRSCVVRYVGDRSGAASYLLANGAAGRAVVGASVVAGDYGAAAAGDRGAATAGDRGAATAGDYGTATAGYRGTATAGYLGTATAGYYGTATAGYYGTATAGRYGTATAGDDGIATAGYGGTAAAGDRGAATAGDRGAATAGDYGTATAGYGGTAAAGYGGEIRIRWYDGARYRLAVGYVGDDGIEPNVAYWCDAAGCLVRADEKGGGE